MRKQYDDFVQLKLKDMCKGISDMTYKYPNPETGLPTKVPPIHYEQILGQVAEQYISTATSRQFLNIMYTQLSNLKKEDEKYFIQALVCIDLGINPKDLRIDEQIAIEYISEFISKKQSIERKNFHFLDTDIVEQFIEAKNNPALHSKVIREENKICKQENNSSRHYDCEER